jgi:hypothetical protein
MIKSHFNLANLSGVDGAIALRMKLTEVGSKLTQSKGEQDEQQSYQSKGKQDEQQSGKHSKHETRSNGIARFRCGSV